MYMDDIKLFAKMKKNSLSLWYKQYEYIVKILEWNLA